MNKDCFWLTDDQFARIKPHLPTDTRGKARVDDRRVISGIVHVLKSGGRWIDAPSVYKADLIGLVLSGPPLLAPADVRVCFPCASLKRIKAGCG